MANMYPGPHGAVCIDPAYHAQYHDSHNHNNHCNKCDCCKAKEDMAAPTDEDVKYKGLPRYDHPHPHPCNHHCHNHKTTILRDEDIGTIVRVESRIIESLLIKLYSSIEDRDKVIKMELGMRYTIKYIDVNGVNECTGVLYDFKASQHSTVYQPANADGYYIIMDCSEVGKSDIKRILISMIRDIVEVKPADEEPPIDDNTTEEGDNTETDIGESSTDNTKTDEGNTTESGEEVNGDEQITEDNESTDESGDYNTNGEVVEEPIDENKDTDAAN